MKKRIAFVIQRYGKEINGGAEYHCRELAEHLLIKYDVDVYTTCAQDTVTWSNYFKPGYENIDGVNVYRFETEAYRDYEETKKQQYLMRIGDDAAGMRWISAMGPYCPKLICELKKNENLYSCVIFMTYVYYTAVFGLSLHIKNSIFLPTAHDESQIYQRIFKRVFKWPDAYIFNSIEERELVYKLFHVEDKPSMTTCIGFSEPHLSENTVPERFKECGEYIIYVGRISKGKNFNQLNDMFIEYKKRCKSSIKLLVVGKPNMGTNLKYHEDIIYCGFVSEEEKIRLMSNAKFLVLPSVHESLSLVILESMQLGKPVLVNAECKVTKGQCIRSNAGLFYSNYIEFEKMMSLLLSDERLCEQLGQNGKNFVRENYNWDKVINNFSTFIDTIGNN